MAILNIEAAIAEMGGDEEIFEAVAETFLEDSVETLTQLKDAFNSSDFEAVCRHAHSLKSSCRTVGGEDAGGCAEELELKAKDGKSDGIIELIENLEQEVGKLKSALGEKGYSL